MAFIGVYEVPGAFIMNLTESLYNGPFNLEQKLPFVGKTRKFRFLRAPCLPEVREFGEQEFGARFLCIRILGCTSPAALPLDRSLP